MTDSRFTGTQVGPDGRRYELGEVPATLRVDRLAQEVRAVGTRDAGDMPIVREDGTIEWLPPETGDSGGSVSVDDSTFDVLSGDDVQELFGDVDVHLGQHQASIDDINEQLGGGAGIGTGGGVKDFGSAMYDNSIEVQTNTDIPQTGVVLDGVAEDDLILVNYASLWAENDSSFGHLGFQILNASNDTPKGYVNEVGTTSPTFYTLVAAAGLSSGGQEYGISANGSFIYRVQATHLTGDQLKAHLVGNCAAPRNLKNAYLSLTNLGPVA